MALSLGIKIFSIREKEINYKKIKEVKLKPIILHFNWKWQFKFDLLSPSENCVFSNSALLKEPGVGNTTKDNTCGLQRWFHLRGARSKCRSGATNVSDELRTPLLPFLQI